VTGEVRAACRGFDYAGKGKTCRFGLSKIFYKFKKSEIITQRANASD